MYVITLTEKMYVITLTVCNHANNFSLEENKETLEELRTSSFTELKSFPLSNSILHRILDSIWEMEEKPADLRDATIVALFKNKGSRADCGSHRGISLLSIAGKIVLC